MSEITVPQLTVLTALNHLLRKSYFDICTIDKCAEILGVSVRGSQPYKLLSALHCIEYSEMPSTLRMQIPELIKDCLGVEPTPLIIEQEVARAGLFRRLLRSAS